MWGTINNKMHQGKPTESKPSKAAGTGTGWSKDEVRCSQYFACIGRAASISAVPTKDMDGWRQIGITIDSGAADSVADPRAFPGYTVSKHPSPIFLPIGDR